jgi:hypothetical protein
MVFCYALYIQKEQIAGLQNDNAMRKSAGQIVWVRALVFILSEEGSLKLYKTKFATETDKWCLNGGR